MAKAILKVDPRDQTERERSVDVLSSELRFHLVGFAASKHENVVAVDIGRVAPHRQIGARSSNVFSCLWRARLRRRRRPPDRCSAVSPCQAHLP